MPVSTLLPQTAADLPAATASAATSAAGLDQLWVLVAATLVFFMQAGFCAIEVGCVRRQNAEAVAFKNLIDYLVAAIGFYLIGFGLMFGHNLGGPVGSDLFAWNGSSQPDGSPLGLTFLLFQLAFASTAVTIVSGAAAERIRFSTYLVGAAVIGVVIYPVFGHWAWGNMFFAGNKTWLTELGFLDFAGSTVVHSVGGWIALVVAILLGPRQGRFDADGRPTAMPSNSLSWAVLGTFILWFGWWGFNGGSTLALNGDVGLILLNTNMAGAAGGLVAFLHARFAQDRAAMKEKMLGGALGGLVAITACCNMVSPPVALLIGALAGIVHNVAYEALLRRRIDDPVGAIPVHLACGIFGTMCVAIFGDVGKFPGEHGRLQQFGVQLLGVIACGCWSVTTAFFVYRLLGRTLGLRVDPNEERTGGDLGPATASAAATEVLADGLLAAMIVEAPNTKAARPGAVSQVAAKEPYASADCD